MRFLVRAIPVALLLLGVTTSAASAKTLECRELPALFKSYTLHHYTQNGLSDELRSRTIDRFVRALDPSRTLLLKSDVDQLKEKADLVFVNSLRGKCGEIEKMMDLLVDRSRIDLELAKSMLDDDYALDESVELVIDPETRGWADTAEARADLVRRQVHFQISSYLTGGLDLKKAKEQLVHRYELNLKRATERRDRGLGPEILMGAYALALDPHSSFLSADDLADFRIQMRLSLEGIGAALRTENGFTYIESLVPGGAAARSDKLQPKDKIIAVKQAGEEPVSTIDMDIRDVVKLIRGPKGSEVTLTILREGKTTKTFDVTIIRDKIDVAQQAASIEYEVRKVQENEVTIAVLELPSFYGGGDGDGRSSYEDVKKLVQEATEKKVDGLVLDLSKNGGGLLQDAVRISGLFIDRGAIVGTKGTRGDFDVLEDTDPKTQYAGPLAVVVSPVSASGAEILAGALQAYRRAIIVGGPQTFGKGTVQTVIPLPNELGAMKITTGMFFLPDGDSTQLQGVKADVQIPSLMAGFDMGEKDLDYALQPQAVDPFRSDTTGARWTAFDPELAGRLQASSKKRIENDEVFAEIREAVAEAKKDRDKINIGELRSESKDDDGDAEDVDEDRFDRMQEALTDEAVDILVDLQRLQKSLKTAKK
jgi:carboxyl-terminal processing protease